MGVVALLIFIGVTVVLNAVLKRNIAEALLVALVACAFAGGAQAPGLLARAVIDGAQSEVTFAGMAFVFMGLVVASTGLIERLIEILNSIFGRLRGGAAYVSTLGSAAIGLVAGSTAGNTATVGSVTIPWMKETGWTSVRSASLVAGNSGLGVSLPPNSTMFILLATPAATGVATGQVYVSLAVGGTYCVLYRLLVVGFWTRRDGIEAASSAAIHPFGQTVRRNWSSTLIFLGILLPVLVTFGPLYDFLASADLLGEKALGEISIIVWVPVLITLIALIEGWRRLKASPETLKDNFRREIPQFATVGVSLFAAFSASNIMDELGVGRQMSTFLGELNLPKSLLILIVCLIAILVATPLSSTATAAAIGAPAVLALTSVGVPSVVAIVTVLICTSTEGASPPVGAPIYLASGMAEANPTETFIPLVVYFVLPIVVIAWLIGMGILPVPS